MTKSWAMVGYPLLLLSLFTLLLNKNTSSLAELSITPIFGTKEGYQFHGTVFSPPPTDKAARFYDITQVIITAKAEDKLYTLYSSSIELVLYPSGLIYPLNSTDPVPFSEKNNYDHADTFNIKDGSYRPTYHYFVNNTLLYHPLTSLHIPQETTHIALSGHFTFDNEDGSDSLPPLNATITPNMTISFSAVYDTMEVVHFKEVYTLSTRLYAHFNDYHHHSVYHGVVRTNYTHDLSTPQNFVPTILLDSFYNPTNSSIGSVDISLYGPWTWNSPNSEGNDKESPFICNINDFFTKPEYFLKTLISYDNNTHTSTLSVIIPPQYHYSLVRSNHPLFLDCVHILDHNQKMNFFSRIFSSSLGDFNRQYERNRDTNVPNDEMYHRSVFYGTIGIFIRSLATSDSKGVVIDSFVTPFHRMTVGEESQHLNIVTIAQRYYLIQNTSLNVYQSVRYDGRIAPFQNNFLEHDDVYHQDDYLPSILNNTFLTTILPGLRQRDSLIENSQLVIFPQLKRHNNRHITNLEATIGNIIFWLRYTIFQTPTSAELVEYPAIMNLQTFFNGKKQSYYDTLPPYFITQLIATGQVAVELGSNYPMVTLYTTRTKSLLYPDLTDAHILTSLNNSETAFTSSKTVYTVPVHKSWVSFTQPLPLALSGGVEINSVLNTKKFSMILKNITLTPEILAQNAEKISLQLSFPRNNNAFAFKTAPKVINVDGSTPFAEDWVKPDQIIDNTQTLDTVSALYDSLTSLKHNRCNIIISKANNTKENVFVHRDSEIPTLFQIDVRIVNGTQITSKLAHSIIMDIPLKMNTWMDAIPHKIIHNGDTLYVACENIGIHPLFGDLSEDLRQDEHLLIEITEKMNNTVPDPAYPNEIKRANYVKYRNKQKDSNDISFMMIMTALSVLGLIIMLLILIIFSIIRRMIKKQRLKHRSRITPLLGGEDGLSENDTDIHETTLFGDDLPIMGNDSSGSERVQLISHRSDKYDDFETPIAKTTGTSNPNNVYQQVQLQQQQQQSLDRIEETGTINDQYQFNTDGPGSSIRYESLDEV